MEMNSIDTSPTDLVNVVEGSFLEALTQSGLILSYDSVTESYRSRPLDLAGHISRVDGPTHIMAGQET